MWFPRFLLASFVVAVAAALACNGDDLVGPTTGTLQITTSTSGPEPDPDGYALQLDVEQPRAIGVAASLQSAELSPGNHTVLLGGTAPNCSVAGENPRTVSITAGATTSVSFEVTCSATPQPDTKIAFVSYRDHVYDIFTTNVDGSRETNLTGDFNPAGSDMSPTWSPDGSRIAFLSRPSFDGPEDISVMNADGSGKATLVPQAGVEVHKSWSPDGWKIAFGSFREGSYQIFTTNLDGGGQTSLAMGHQPVWSPDGSRIAFVRIIDRGFDLFPLRGRIFIMNADGSNQVALTNPGGDEGDHDPRWSPDGATIAFIRSGEEDIDGFFVQNLWTMKSDGSELRQLTNLRPSPSGSVVGYDWSPDGSKLAFGCSESRFQADVCTIRPDGTGQVNLTNASPTRYEYPIWSREGSRILLSARLSDPLSEDYGPSDLFVINSDGSNLANVTNSASDDIEGAWQP